MWPWLRERDLLPPPVRSPLSGPPTARYPVGGWTTLIELMSERARRLGVKIQTGARVDELPDPPVIIATELADARALLDDDSLDWLSGHAVCFDLALRHQR